MSPRRRLKNPDMHNVNLNAKESITLANYRAKCLFKWEWLATRAKQPFRQFVLSWGTDNLFIAVICFDIYREIFKVQIGGFDG